MRLVLYADFVLASREDLFLLGRGPLLLGEVRVKRTNHTQDT